MPVTAKVTMMTLTNEVIEMAIAALEDAVKFTNMGFEFSEGDVFGNHHNDAVDALNGYANAITELRVLLDKPEAKRAADRCAASASASGEWLPGRNNEGEK